MWSVVLARNPANAAVVLAVVLGSRTVEMIKMVTQMLIIHGLRASWLAKVCCGEDDF